VTRSSAHDRGSDRVVGDHFYDVIEVVSDWSAHCYDVAALLSSAAAESRRQTKPRPSQTNANVLS